MNFSAGSRERKLEFGMRSKEKLLETILQRAAMLTGTEHGYIYLLEPGESEMQMQVGMGFF